MNERDDAGAIERSCGDCRLCCRLLRVESHDEGFDKPQGRWCEHAGDGGCAIYPDRPKPCRTFRCAWYSGAFDERDRPDRVHLVVALEMGIGDELKDANGKVVARNLPVWCVYEAWPGVAAKPRGRAVLALLERMTVRTRSDPEREGGPFPICLIPSATGMRRMKFPGSSRWIPCLRPGETMSTSTAERSS